MSWTCPARCPELGSSGSGPDDRVSRNGKSKPGLDRLAGGEPGRGRGQWAGCSGTMAATACCSLELFLPVDGALATGGVAFAQDRVSRHVSWPKLCSNPPSNTCPTLWQRPWSRPSPPGKNIVRKQHGPILSVRYGWPKSWAISRSYFSRRQALAAGKSLFREPESHRQDSEIKVDGRALRRLA